MGTWKLFSETQLEMWKCDILYELTRVKKEKGSNFLHKKITKRDFLCPTELLQQAHSFFGNAKATLHSWEYPWMSLAFWCVMAHMLYLVVHRRKTSCPVMRREKKDNGDQVPSPFATTGWLDQPAWIHTMQYNYQFCQTERLAHDQIVYICRVGLVQ